MISIGLIIASQNTSEGFNFACSISLLDLMFVLPVNFRRRVLHAGEYYLLTSRDTRTRRRSRLDQSARGNFLGERARLYRPRDGVNEPVQVVSIRNSTVPVQIDTVHRQLVDQRRDGKEVQREREREREASFGEYLRDL